MKSKVSIIECRSYEQTQVDEALAKSLELIGGLRAFVKAGDKVIIKPNALMGADPESAITTHPTIVHAVVKAVKNIGGLPFVGDSPGDSSVNITKTMHDNGIKEATEKAGGQMINFHEVGSSKLQSPSNNKNNQSLNISKAVLDADIVINLPKFKTHNFTIFTGAVKNLFGCVPGFSKAKCHALAPHPYELSKSLVDVLEIVKPKLNIMDAVYGMEGKGPTNGHKRFMGAIMASSDAVALDAIASFAMGCRPLDIDSTRIAHQRGLGKGMIEQIEVVGSSLDKIKQKDWQLPPNIHKFIKYIPPFFARPFVDQLRINPVIIQEACTKCLICVNNCPAHTIHQKNGKIVIDLSNCIMCFCCHELCPYRAIQLKRSWLTKLLGIGKDE